MWRGLRDAHVAAAAARIQAGFDLRQEKSVNCGTKAADVLEKILAGKLMSIHLIFRCT